VVGLLTDSTGSRPHEMRLVVVVPFLDEADHLPGLLESMAAQTRAPDRLVLVDDGSTDASAGIADGFARAHTYARVLRRPPHPVGADRLATAAELVAVRWAIDQLEEPWDVIGKIDADLVLSAETLATILDAFADDPGLGMAGAFISEMGAAGPPVRKSCGPGHVEGATKFYRRACWEAIAPLPAIVGWDMFDEIRAQMRGWRTASFAIPGGDPLHRRPMGSRDGLLRAYRRWGAGAYTYGEHPLHVALLAVRDVRARPPVLGSANYLAGWALAALRRRPRCEPELRAHVRRHQLRRIRRRITASPHARSSVSSVTAHLRLLTLRVVTLLKRRVLRPYAGRLLASPVTAGLRVRAGVMRPAGVLQVLDRLEAAGLAVWVAGGWGVDALVGHQTRRHADLDLLLDCTDERRALAELALLGYGTVTSERVSSPLMPRRVAVYDAMGRSVDLHPVDVMRWLATVAAERLAGAGDPARAAFAEGRIGGRPVPCLSADLQIAAHNGYLWRDADREDFRTLRAMAGAPWASK